MCLFFMSNVKLAGYFYTIIILMRVIIKYTIFIRVVRLYLYPFIYLHEYYEMLSMKFMV